MKKIIAMFIFTALMFVFVSITTAGDDENKADVLGRVARLDNAEITEDAEDKQALGRFYLDEAKKCARQIGKEKEADEHKALARKYLGEAIVKEELPEAVEYKQNKNKYRFPLVAGEQTICLIEVDTFNMSLSSAKDCQYDKLYDDGRIFKKGERRSPYRSIKFKLRAYSDCTQNGGIGLLVK